MAPTERLLLGVRNRLGEGAVERSTLIDHGRRSRKALRGGHVVGSNYKLVNTEHQGRRVRTTRAIILGVLAGLVGNARRGLSANVGVEHTGWVEFVNSLDKIGTRRGRPGFCVGHLERHRGEAGARERGSPRRLSPDADELIYILAAARAAAGGPSQRKRHQNCLYRIPHNVCPPFVVLAVRHTTSD